MANVKKTPGTKLSHTEKKSRSRSKDKLIKHPRLKKKITTYKLSKQTKLKTLNENKQSVKTSEGEHVSLARQVRWGA